MLIKLAGFYPPFVPGPGAFFEAGTIGTNLHDLGHLMTTRSNKAGRWIQTSSIADGIIAAKKATEGKMVANRKAGGALIYSLSPQKVIALHEFNQLVQTMPGGDKLFKFKGNRLNTKNLKKMLGTANTFDNMTVGVQVAAPVVGFTGGYAHAKQDGDSTSTAVKRGLKGAALGGAISAGLIIPRKILSTASGMHEHLSKDKGYGYEIIEEAAKKAEKSMNRPKMFNYSHFAYDTPENNFKGNAGKLGDGFKKILGQKSPTGYSQKHGWTYPEETTKKTIWQKIKNQANEIPKAFGINLR